MKILHYCARIRLVDGGVVRSVLDLTSALSRSGTSITLMATDGKDWPSCHSGVETMLTGEFDRSPLRFSVKRLRYIQDHIEQADVLHLHTPWEPANRQLAKIARACCTPYGISIHGILDDWCMKHRSFKKRI